MFLPVVEPCSGGFCYLFVTILIYFHNAPAFGSSRILRTQIRWNDVEWWLDWRITLLRQDSLEVRIAASVFEIDGVVAGEILYDIEELVAFSTLVMAQEGYAWCAFRAQTQTSASYQYLTPWRIGRHRVGRNAIHFSIFCHEKSTNINKRNKNPRVHASAVRLLQAHSP